MSEFASQLDMRGKDKMDVAIERLREYEPSDGYWLAFSGGKDSVVLYDLAVKAGVKFEAHYNLTTVDPPELVNFIRNKYPQVKIWHPAQTMWQLIEKQGLPYRTKRFCCRILKEAYGTGAVLTGVRHEESASRAKRCVFEYSKRSKDKWFVRPIIDWLTTEVWSYIHAFDVPYCELYEQGFKRIGCVLCPFASSDEKARMMVRYPKIAAAYKRAYFRYRVNHPDKNDFIGLTDEQAFQRWIKETPRQNRYQGGLI